MVWKRLIGCRTGVILAVAFSGLGAANSAEVPPATTMPLAASDALADQVAVDVEAKGGKMDLLPLLEDAVKNYGSDAQKKGAALGRLTDGLINGVQSDVLIDKILQTVHVGSGNGTQDYLAGWKYGTYYERTAIIKTLWDIAVEVQPKNPQRASEFARASVFLSALNDFQLGWTGIERVIKDPENSKKLLALPDAEFKKLQGVAKARQEENSIYMDEVESALKGIDQVAASKPGRVGLTAVEGVLAHLDKAFRNGVPQDGSRWWLIDKAWALKNLLKSLNSDEGLKAVMRQLEVWRRDFPSQTMDRWIDEATRNEGAPPGKMIGEYTMQPDGKIVPVNSGQQGK